ncbi:hypothetical protein QUF50_04170 [Thiotrichales bacterium HSG1]|nr:hypothetical protein [Thiotrichales bacterium HSG1]
MEWHVITGSKGGVGKTLLSLLLLAYHLEEKTNEGILVLDLNAMNTDTAAILRFGSKVSNDFEITVEKVERNEPNRIIKFQDVSYEVYSKQKSFAVGWTVNPFLLYKYNDFANLLLGIKKHAQDIANELEISPLKHVIIDTNYHFCNLFGTQDEQYAKYQENCADDHFNVWFLWVYRQLKQIKEEFKSSEIQTIMQTAKVIERIFEHNMGPIINTYTPLGMLPTEAKKGGIFGVGGEGVPNKNKDYIIKELEKLEKLEKVGNYISFQRLIKKLQNVRIEENELGDTRRIFSANLYKAIQEISDDEFLPINIFPLPIYQPALEGYTDRERTNTIALLRELETYKKFKKLLNRKYDNEIL